MPNDNDNVTYIPGPRSDNRESGLGQNDYSEEAYTADQTKPSDASGTVIDITGGTIAKPAFTLSEWLQTNWKWVAIGGLSAALAFNLWNGRR